MKDKQPIAFLAWALVSDEIMARFYGGDTRIAAEEWRSGRNVVIVDCVSPFADRAEVEHQFRDGLAKRG